MHEHVTLIGPDPRGPNAPGLSSGLPADLLVRSAARIQSVALLYACIFFLAGIFPALLFPDRARFIGSFVQWGPSVIGIAGALLVAAVIRSDRLSLPAAMNLGLLFEVASSYGIAAAEFADPMGLECTAGCSASHGLPCGWCCSRWWCRRRLDAVLAALASVSSVPVVIGFMIATGVTTARLDFATFFIGLVFPYLVVVVMAYVGSRVVYNLGTEVKRARAPCP